MKNKRGEKKMEWIGRIIMIMAVMALALLPTAKARGEGMTLADKNIVPEKSYKKVPHTTILQMVRE